MAVLLVTMSVPSGVDAETTTGGAAADDGESAALAGVGSPILAQQENNTTVRHEDPDETNEDGDLSRVSGVLAGQLGEISVDCSEGIRVGNYDACEELDEDGEYGDALSKYVDVSGRDGGGGGDGSGDGDDDSGSDGPFGDLQEEQQEFANETREFRQTYQEYQEARRNGNISRARQLARELLELREDIQRTGTNVSRSANEVSNQTDVSLAPVEENTLAVTRNVSNTTETVVTTVFLPTTMTTTREGTGNISAGTR
jgi:hypothetical protein